MKRTPLFTTHLERGAAMVEHDGWMVPAGFGAAEPDVDALAAGVVDLAHMGLLTFSAEAARRWANGMFTNNVKRLAVGHGQRSAMCDDRGRLQGLLDLYCLDEHDFLVALEGVTTDWFEQRYRMFLILDDIEVDVLEGEWTLLSVQGPDAARVVAAAGLPTPEADRRHLVDEASGTRVARRDRTGLGGFDLFVKVDRVAAVWASLVGAGAVPFGLETLDALRIRAGRAAWPQDGTDKTMIHELRLNEDVCAFDKGCYVGQEVINRIDVKGILTKKLMGLSVDGAAPLGAAVVLGDQVVGTVTSAADGRALAVLRKSAWEPGTAVVVRASDGERPAIVADLPFA